MPAVESVANGEDVVDLDELDDESCVVVLDAHYSKEGAGCGGHYHPGQTVLTTRRSETLLKLRHSRLKDL